MQHIANSTTFFTRLSSGSKDRDRQGRRTAHSDSAVNKQVLARPVEGERLFYIAALWHASEKLIPELLRGRIVEIDKSQP